MRKPLHFTLTCGLFTLLLAATAQDSDPPKTLFGPGSGPNAADLGFNLAPAVGFTSMDGSSTSLFHLRGGVSYKDKLTVGGYFNTALNEIRPKSEVLTAVYMDYWSVGGYAEYTLLADQLLHLTVPLMVGVGEVQMDNETGDAGLGESNFLVVEPAAMLEINLSKHLRFNAGAGYRWVSDMAYRSFSAADISGITGYVGLRFGLFR